MLEMVVKDGKSIEMVVEESDSDVEDVYDETANFMASKNSKGGSGIGNKSFYERLNEDYDDDAYDREDLAEEQLIVMCLI
ncbi:hypothetical protein Tco_1241763 [Tanacetum coccineum]